MSDDLTPTPTTPMSHLTFGKSPYSTLLADVTQRHLLLQGKANLSSDDILASCRQNTAWNSQTFHEDFPGKPHRHNYVNIAGDFEAWLQAEDNIAMCMQEQVKTDDLERMHFGSTLPGHYQAFDDQDMTLVVSIDDLSAPEHQVRTRAYTNDSLQFTTRQPRGLHFNQDGPDSHYLNLSTVVPKQIPQDWIAPTKFEPLPSKKSLNTKKQFFPMPKQHTPKSRHFLATNWQFSGHKSPTVSADSATSCYSSGSLTRKPSFRSQARKFVADGFGTISADVRKFARSVRSRAVTRPQFRQMSLIERSNFTQNALANPAEQYTRDNTPIYATVSKRKPRKFEAENREPSSTSAGDVLTTTAAFKPRFFTGEKDGCME